VVNLAPTFSPFHVFGFSRSSLTAMLRRFGFEPAVWRFYTGAIPLPRKPTMVGMVEWLSTRAVKLVSRGSLGGYMECFARRT
jgi:hypothetical protein